MSDDANGNRRKYPREANGVKDEWGAVGTHLAELSGAIKQAELNIKHLRAQELQ
jgi:hypothetical protein